MSMPLDPEELTEIIRTKWHRPVAVPINPAQLYTQPDDRDRLFDVVTKEYRTRCPCCLRPMLKMKEKASQRMPKTALTKGHVYSAANASTRDIWFRQCVECNHDQGAFELGAWATYLTRRGDRRAGHVVALCGIVYRWLDANGRRLPADKVMWQPGPIGLTR